MLSTSVLKSVIAVLLLLPCARVASAADAPPFAKWAFQTLTTIQKHYAMPDGLYRQQPDKGRASDLWAAGVQLSALNAAAELDPHRIGAAVAYADALEKNYRTNAHGIAGYAPVPHDGGRYFDDNEWIVLDLIETYEVSHQKRFLDRAEMLMRFVASGESPDLGGGIWWNENRDQKNTCSNAPAICCALRLFQINHDPRLLALAKRVYAWTNSHFQDSDGLYFDGMMADGTIHKTKWSYNSALMLRANCLFYKITGEGRYLTAAQFIAESAEKRWFRPSDGALKDDSQFAHLLCEALFDLTRIDHAQEHVNKIDRALVYLHGHIRLPDGLYPKRWEKPAGPNDHDFNLMYQASAARGYAEAALAQKAIP